MAYEYKCIGAPERAKRKRGTRTRTDRVAAAMHDVISAEAVDGWEYMRTDLVPVEEKSGLFSRAVEVHRAILVFRRSTGAEAQPASLAPVIEQPSLKAPQAAPEPAEEPIRLAAAKEPEPVGAGPAPSATRAPRGLS